jgi:spoIIIJ-associated protein
MTEKIEYTGKDVTEAIQKACRDLRVTQEELKIEVISPGAAGIFGMFGKKQAVIAVTMKKGRSQEKTGGRGETRSRTSGPKRTERKKTGGVPRRSPERPPAEINAETLAAIQADLEKILQLMGLDAQVVVTNEENKVIAKLSGGNEEEIIGPEGQTLDSLQYLMRKIISRKVEGKVMFALDAGTYREVRREDLEEMALRLAGEVKESGRTKSIPALNPAERRIVHMKLQDDPTIRSRSVGEGQFKKILIYLPGRGKKSKNG